MVLCLLLLLQIIPMSVYAISANYLITEENKSNYSSNISQESAEPEILCEDISKRDSKNIKYFKMSDGTTKAIVYRENVHYMDNNKMWQEINNDLVESPVDPSEELYNFDGLETKHNSVKFKFAKNSNQNNLFSIKKGKYLLSFKLMTDHNDKNPIFSSSITKEKIEETKNKFIVSNIKQKVTYKNILSNTNFEYIVDGENLKENIIIKKKQQDYHYSFMISTKGLCIKVNDNNLCEYDKDTNKQIFILPKPFMYDSNGKMSFSVEYKVINKGNDKYKVTIIPNKEWMNDSSRKFPVIIDPAVWTEQSKSAIDTVYVASKQPTTNRWTDPMIVVGKDSSNVGICHGLLKFELPKINPGDVIVDAYLTAAQTNVSAYSPTTPDSQIEIHEITSAWDKKKVNWKNHPSYNNMVIDYEVLKASEVGSKPRQRDWNVTSVVKGWYEDPTKHNYGLLLKSSTENKSSLNDSCIYMWLYGEKYAQNQSGYPLLTITFKSNKGLEPYWSYTNINAGRAGTASICDFSGNLVFTHNDVTSPGSRAPVNISHVFNNYMARDRFGTIMPYRGHGWMLSCQKQVLPTSKFGLTKSQQEKYPYVFIDGDGTEHYFYKDNKGKMIDEDGLGLELSVPKIDNNNYYKIIDKNKNVFWFNVSGGFARSLDNNNNQIANYYKSATENQLRRVSDGAGNIISFEATSDNLAISSIIDSAGRKTQFIWRTGQLVRIIYPNNEVTYFTYDNDGSMLSVKAPDGYELIFSYTSINSGKRISKVVEKSNGEVGQTISFDYSTPGTTIKHTSGKDDVYGNSDDLYTTIRFDSAGRTISTESNTQGESLASTSTNYTGFSANSDRSNAKQLNRIKESMYGNIFSRNYLREGSADKGGIWNKSQWNGSADYDAWVSSRDQYFGRWSYYLNSKTMDDGAGARAYQDLKSGQFKPGTTYTFSAWVKTKDIASINGKKYGAEIMATYWLPDNSTKDFHSEAILGTTDSQINNGWQRVSVTFKVPTNATYIRCNILIRNSIGEAWFDGMQLEEGEIANRFNLISNSSFERYSRDSTGAYLAEDWYGYNTDSKDSVDNAHSKDSGHAFRFWSLPNKTKEYSQVINLLGNTAKNLDDTYIVSGWVYSNPIEGINDNSKLAICAKVTYTDGTFCRNWFDFNSRVKGWQYIMGVFTLRDVTNKDASKVPQYITIHLINYRQSNYSWFDNIQLIKDEVPSYTYDKDGNLVNIVESSSQKSSMEFSNNTVKKFIDPSGYDYNYMYDSNNNITQATSQRGTKYCYQYDQYGNPTSLSVKGTNTMALETDFSYSYNGDYITSIKDNDGFDISYYYNMRKGTLSSQVDKYGRKTSYSYDNNTDQLTDIIQHISETTQSKSHFTYEKDLLKSINSDDTIYSFTYDNFGNNTNVRIGNNLIESRKYGDNNGKLKEIVYGNGYKEQYKYDDYGNINEILSNGVARGYWKYDSLGNMYSHTDPIDEKYYTYTYDSLGRMIRENVKEKTSLNNIYSIEYGYDLNNNINRFSSNTGSDQLTEKYVYGKDNLISSYSYPNGTTVSYRYDSLLRRNRNLINTKNPIEHRFLYHMSERGGDFRTTKIGWEYINQELFLYNYDKLGNIKEILWQKEGIENLAEKIQIFEYDEYNRLTRVNDSIKNCTEVFSYDKRGNIISASKYPLTFGTIIEEDLIERNQYTYNNIEWKDQLSNYNGKEITYDSIGNPLNYKQFQLEWINGRELFKLESPDLKVTYQYDIDGFRTSKTVNNIKHEYYYVGNNLQYEKFGDAELWFFYDGDGTPSGLRYKKNGVAKDYILVCNWQGDVKKIYDNLGVLVAEYNYDSWGNIINVLNANGEKITSPEHIAIINPLRYRGYYYDSESGLYYLNSRYYDPETKRMVNPDSSNVLFSLPETLSNKNLYAYGENNPIIISDNDGELSEEVILAAGGIVISVGLQLLSQGGIHCKEDCYKLIAAGVIGGVSAMVSPYFVATCGPVYGTSILNGITTGTSDFVMQNIDNGFNLHEIDFGEIVYDSMISTGVSLAGGAIINNKVTKIDNASNSLKKSFLRSDQGLKKILIVKGKDIGLIN